MDGRLSRNCKVITMRLFRYRLHSCSPSTGRAPFEGRLAVVAHAVKRARAQTRKQKTESFLMDEDVGESWLGKVG